MDPTDQTPQYLTRYALTRLLKEFASEIGFGEELADAVAQIHMQRTTIPERWSSFIVTNCAGCVHNMHSCRFLNPREDNCVAGATPATVKAAHAIGIERGKIISCPQYLGDEHDDEA